MQIYKTILTQTGINKLAMAAGATPLRITHMAVGDGNGAETTPNEEQTTLVNEVYRTDINSWEVDPNNPNQRIAEMFLSETVGGWWVYELGLFDADGDLIAVANTPASYKSVMAQGSGRTMTLEMVIAIGNSASVEVIVDPSQAMVSRAYLSQTIDKEKEKTALRNFKDLHSCLQLIKASYGSVNVLGDSITEGVGASSFPQSWYSMFYQMIMDMEQGQDAEIISNFEISGKYGVEISGPASITDAGPIGKALLMENLSSLYFYGDFEFVEVYFNRTPSAGKLQFMKDGVVYKTIDCAGENIVDALTFPSLYTSRGYGRHTIKAVDGDVTLTGLIRLNHADERIHINRMAFSGASSTDFNTPERLASIKRQGAFFESKKNLFIIALGTNDIYNSGKATTPDQLKANIKNIAVTLNHGDNVVAIMIPPIADEHIWPAAKARHIQYAASIRLLAAELGVMVIDCSSLDLLENNMYIDGVHPNDAGHQAIFEHVVRQLNGLLGVSEAALEPGVHGTWLPSIAGYSHSGQNEYEYRHGHYVKMGRLVIAQVAMGVKNIDPAMDGYIGVNLPFPTSSSIMEQSGAIGMIIGVNLPDTSRQFVIDCIKGEPFAIIRGVAPGQPYADVVSVSDNARLAFTISYFTD